MDHGNAHPHAPTRTAAATAAATPSASWMSLPMDLRRDVASWVPSPADAARLGCVDRSSRELVEGAMRDRLVAVRRRIRRRRRIFLNYMSRKKGGVASSDAAENVVAKDDDDYDSEDVLELPPGVRSWLPLAASRSGLLPPDDRLVLLENDDDGEETLTGTEQEIEGDDDSLDGRISTRGSVGSAVETFHDLGLGEALSRGIEEYGYDAPSSLQRRCLRPLTNGARSALIISPSGTGKTAACAIGVLHNIDPALGRCQALVLTPSRELAVIMNQWYGSLGKYLNVTTLACTSLRETVSSLLKGGIHLMFGTPGRIVDVIYLRPVLDVRSVRHLVLEKADEILERGYCDLIYGIFAALPLTARAVVTTATLTYDVLRLTSNLLVSSSVAGAAAPAVVRLMRPELTLEAVRQFYLEGEGEDWKFEALFDLLDCLSNPMIIYVNTLHTAALLTEELRNRGIHCTRIQAGRSQRDERERILSEFRGGESQAVIITEGQSGFILRQEIAILAVNYDLPETHNRYLRRVGRKGRLASRGIVINFVTAREMQALRNFELFFNTSIDELPMDIATLV